MQGSRSSSGQRVLARKVVSSAVWWSEYRGRVMDFELVDCRPD